VVERAQHALELAAAAQDQAGRGNHAVGALTALEPRIFLDAVDRDLAGMTKHRKHRAVVEEINCVIAPLAGRDLAAIETKNAIKFAPAEGNLAGAGGTQLAPAPGPPVALAAMGTPQHARFDFAGDHAAPPFVAIGM
jgi:hypothetical protein